ncbi:MAG: hypothetical protein ACYTAF_14640 [Planctomycetota bacterium]|jgi:hypothetical protein
MSQDSHAKKPSRLAWFLTGVIFTVLVAGAAAFFVPFIQVPGMPDGDGTPDRGNVSAEEGAQPGARSLTIVEYLKEKPFDIKVEKPNIELPDFKKEEDKPAEKPE